MLRRCFGLSLLLIFFPFAGCQSFMELARAMEEKENEDAQPPSKLKQNERERQIESARQNESVRHADSRRDVNVPDDGYFRLILNEKTGSFSLYFLSDPEKVRYEPLFNSSDPSASYLTAYVDGQVYHLGNSKQFKTRFERIGGAPAIVYESSFLIVTQIFTPIKTLSSPVANGVMISYTIENTATQRSSIGLRMLLDTELGEGRKQVPFITNTQIVSSELLLEGSSEERFWVSRGKTTALMGSIVSPVDAEEKGPDIVHMANWKRLNDTPWRLRYLKGRSFNNLPSSIRDSAVCYFFGPAMVDRNNTISYTIYLTTEDIAWYNMTAPLPVGTATMMNPPAPSAKPAAAPAPVSAAPAPAAAQPPSQVPSPLPAPAPVPAPVPEPAQQTTAVVVPAPVYIDNTTIDIALIEAEARAEAGHYYREGIHEDVNTLFLLKLQDILDQFVDGHILLNEQDLINIEGAIEKLRVRN